MAVGLESKDVFIFAAGVALTVVVSFYFYRKGLLTKRIAYTTDRDDLVFRSRQYPDELREGLKITFEGRDVEGLTRVRLYIWNAGSQPITKADLKTKSPLEIAVAEGFVILQASVAYQTRSASNATLKARQVAFDYLNSGDGIILEIFGDVRVDQRELSRPVRLEGEVVGMRNPPKFERPSRSVPLGASPAQIFGLAIFFTAGMIVSTWIKDGIVVTISGVLVALGIAVAGLMLMFAERLLFERMPGTLLNRGLVGPWGRLGQRIRGLVRE